MSVAPMTLPCNAARRCSSWLGLQTRAGFMGQRGSCRLLRARMLCTRTTRVQGPTVM